MVSQDGCKKMFEHVPNTHYPWDAESMVCAGGADRDACQVGQDFDRCHASQISHANKYRSRNET